MVRVLLVLQLAFTIWMLVDAIRRRADLFWFLILIFFWPMGAFLYFFMVKRHDWNVSFSLPRGAGGGAPRRGSLRALRDEYERTPSQQNRMRFAEALYAAKKHDEARSLLEEALRADPRETDALYGLGLIAMEQGRHADAVGYFEKLLDIERSYEDWAAWPHYLKALWALDRRTDALAAADRLVKGDPRMRHVVLKARYLAKDGQKDRAKNVLREALAEHEESPPFVQRAGEEYARKARSMLRSL